MKTKKLVNCPQCGGFGFTSTPVSTDYEITVCRAKTCELCHGAGVIEDPMTNADRIRASIEDNKKLAELTIKCKSVFSRTKGYTETVYVCSDGSVTDDWSIALNHEMEWLQQPAEEDDHA